MSKRALNARARKRGSRPVAHRPAASRPVAQRSGVQRPGAPHPKRPATRTAGSPALVPSPLVLPAECTLADAESLKLKLAALLQDVSPVTLDVSGVRRIDTASLQLLAAFARDRRARGLRVEVSGESPAFAEGMRLLGLARLIGAAEDSPAGSHPAAAAAQQV